MVTNKVIILFLLYFNLNYANQCVDNCDCWNSNEISLTINCSKRNITKLPSTFPTQPQHLTISYAYNPLIKLTKLPPTISVVSISFKNCSLRDLDYDIFIDVTNIKFVDLSYNQLHYENLVPEVFQGKFNEDDYEPIGLEELNLAYNKISSLDIKVFEHCPHLTVLDLSGNPLHILDDGTWFAINTLHHLKHLNLSNTYISTLPEKQILNDRLQLVILDLSDNNFEKVPEVLGTMSQSLEILSISNNPIEELNDQSFIGLENLRELSVNRMEKLQTIKHNTFSNLKNLKTLHLDHNPNLMYINENAFGISENWPPIIELYINDNNLKELSPTLLNWTKITVAKFEGNDWNCECKTLPCLCIGVDIAYRNLPNPRNEQTKPGMRRPYLLVIPIVLGILAVVVSWRVLRKYRNRRLVNAMYPIMYIATPTTVQ